MILFLQGPFKGLARLAVDYWVIFVIVPLLVSGGLSVGFMYLSERQDSKVEYTWVPDNGRFYHELDCMNEHWPLKRNDFVAGKQYGMEFWVETMVIAKPRPGNPGNILEPAALEELRNFTDHIMNELSVKVDPTSETSFTYRDLCLNEHGKCYQNEIVRFLGKEDTTGKYFDLTYPRSDLQRSPVFVANLLGSVILADPQGHLKSARGVRLLFYLLDEPEVLRGLSEKWLYVMQDYVKKFSNTSRYIDAGLFHTNSLRDGLQDVGASLIPKFTVTFTILIIFSILCSVTYMPVTSPLNPKKIWYVVDWVQSKPLLAFGGVISAGLGIGSGMGVLMLTGQYEFHSIIYCVPFLVLSIGVDDMFIMLAAWRRTSPMDTVARRLEITMGEAALSITITSLTDVLSFGVGTITHVPGVRLFCTYAAICIVFTYLYQITFFVGLMVITGRMEEKRMHCLFLCAKVKDQQEPAGVIQSLFMSGRSGKDFEEGYCSSMGELKTTSRGLSSYLFSELFAPFLLKPVTQVCVVVLYVVYLAVAIWGCAHVKEGLQFDHLLFDDHHSVNWMRISKNYFWQEGSELQVIINNFPRNISNSRDRNDLLEAISEMENSDFTMAANATQFWLREYMIYLKHLEAKAGSKVLNELDVWGGLMRNWLRNDKGKQRFSLDVVWADPGDGEEPHVIKASRVVIGIKNFVQTTDHRNAAVTIRKLAERHPQFNITTYHRFWSFADQYLIILPNTVQNVAIAIGVMAVISFIMIPGISASILITLSIISIDVGVIGYMTFWNVNLDTISMITVIMSIGFSVDLAAHTAYAFIVAEGTSAEKIAISLATMGWPVFQGGLSTVLGVLTLVFVKVYMVETFFKTIFLVVVFGLAHGLIFLPLALKWTNDVNDKFCNFHPRFGPVVKSCMNQLQVFSKQAPSDSSPKSH